MAPSMRLTTTRTTEKTMARIRFHLVTVTILLLPIILLAKTNLPTQNSADSAIFAQARPEKKTPIVLDEQSWTRLLEGEWMFDLYAPWCPACKKLQPEWRKFAEWSDDLNINVASADVTTNPALSGRFMVRGLPTIYHVKDGVFRIYNGPREHTALINFIEEQGWKAVEPVSRWLAPDTMQMSILAYSFRISMTLRDIHNHLVDNVGLPYYVSYVIFALCTVTLGTVLGLLIVFVIDLFIPARYPSADAREATPAGAAKRKATSKGTAATAGATSKRKESPTSSKDSDLEDADSAKVDSSVDSASKVRRRAKN